MTVHKSKPRARLRKIKMYYQRKHEHWQTNLNSQLHTLYEHLHELRCAQVFYHRAVEAIMYHEEEPQDNKELMLGAYLVSDYLLGRHLAVQQSVEQTQQWVRQHIG